MLCVNPHQQTTRSYRTSASGFTLVETLVALTILLLVIAGPMTVAQKGMQNAYFATEQVASIFYAQQAIEAVRERRDNLALEAYANSAEDTALWPRDVNTNCANSCTLTYDRPTGNFALCSDPGQCGAITGTPFRRVITLSSISSGNAQVSVSVSWSSAILGDRTTTIETWIYDHYRRYEN